MKQIIFIFLFESIFLIAWGQQIVKNPHWKLIWAEEFEQKDQIFDTLIWSKIPRGKSDWNNYMSELDTCYALKDGKLILRGMKNPAPERDTATYITGGIYTKGKYHFYNGRLEIKAKLQGAKGAWPAIWLLPEGKKWPHGGEIDIMERLNEDSIVYQTVHSYYTYVLKMKDEPPHFATAPINPEDYNVYAVESYPDSLIFFVNDKHTFTYSRIETDKEGQFPFDGPFYLLIDMQLGGNWVGSVNPEDLPVEMKVDWVRYYSAR